MSAESRKLKSLGEDGRGMGLKGRMASRSRSVEMPTARTDSVRLRERDLRLRSMREKVAAPSRGNANAAAAAIAVTLPSMSNREMLPDEAAERSISTLCRNEARCVAITRREEGTTRKELSEGGAGQRETSCHERGDKKTGERTPAKKSTCVSPS